MRALWRTIPRVVLHIFIRIARVGRCIARVLVSEMRIRLKRAFASVAIAARSRLLFHRLRAMRDEAGREAAAMYYT